MQKEIILRRLAIIKQLYNQGVEQTKRSENLASFSILSFHDSVEMLLKLYSEFKNKKEVFSFPKYWDEFPELPLKEQMNSLSLRRKNLKHKGLFPSKLDIDHSKFSTKDFLKESIELIDGIKFDSISLTELVSNNEVRELLKESENQIDKKNYDLILENTAKAFAILIRQYEKKADGNYSSPFFFGEDLSFHNSFFMGFDSSELPSEFRKLGEFIDKSGESIKQMQFAIKIISLGLDYKKYVLFKYLTPNATFTIGGDIICEMWSGHKKEQYPENELSFLINFVVECSLKLQEFEIDYEKLNFEIPEVIIKEINN